MVDGVPQSVMSKGKDVGRRSVELFLHHTKFLLICCGGNVDCMLTIFFLLLWSHRALQFLTIATKLQVP